MRSLRKTLRFIGIASSLHSGADTDGTVDSIRDNVKLRGANIWMLVCSAVLASIGLDVDSTAVIIGAMLISPLMSPILGVGLGVAISDSELLRSSLRNLSAAVLLSLATSFLYFELSPLGQLTSELSARTTPTLLDVAVAFFGGVAGIVAGSRSNKTTAIPGVAIATALMPPICTAGFGLATANLPVFLGASYLFFINAVFIGLATYAVSRVLKLPKVGEPDSESRVRMRWTVLALVLLTLAPSVVIFWDVVVRTRFNNGVKNFVNNEVRREDVQPVRWDVAFQQSERVLKIFSVGRELKSDEIRKLESQIASYGIEPLKLSFVRLNVSRDDLAKNSAEIESVLSAYFDEIQRQEDARQAEIAELKAEIDRLRSELRPKKRFLTDMVATFPELKSLKWKSDDESSTDNGLSNQPLVLIAEFKDEVSDAVRREIRRRILVMAEGQLAERLVGFEEAVGSVAQGDRND